MPAVAQVFTVAAIKLRFYAFMLQRTYASLDFGALTLLLSRPSLGDLVMPDAVANEWVLPQTRHPSILCPRMLTTMRILSSSDAGHANLRRLLLLRVRKGEHTRAR